MKEKDALYAKPDFNDEDGIRLGELEGEFAEMDGWNAEVDAEILLNGLGITNELHELKMKELDGNQKTIERKCEQQVQDFTKQQENILNDSYNFNN